MDQALKSYDAADWLWRFRIQKARILASQSNPTTAISLLNDHFPASLAATDIAVMRFTILGAAYRIAQEFAQSEKALAEAEALATSSYPALLAKVYVEKGSLKTDQRDFVGADEAYHRALVLARQQGNRDQEAAAQVNLARLAMSRSMYDEAVDRNLAALAASRSLGKETFVATALGNLGWTYFQLGDFDNAFEFYKQAVAMSEHTGLTGYRLYWFTGLVNSYLAVRDYGAAESLASSTLNSARALRNEQTTTECLNDLARIALRTNRNAEAEQHIREALGTHDKLGRLDALLLAGEIATAQGRFDDANELFGQVLAAPDADPPLVWQARAGLASALDRKGDLVAAEELHRKAINAVEKSRASINHDELRLSFLSSGIGVYGDYIDFLIAHDRPEDALRQADLSRARTLAEGLSVKTVTKSHSASARPQQLAQRLGATLLVYWLGEKQSYLWAVTPTKTEYFKLPPAAEIDALVKTYREATLKSADLLAAAAGTGKKLYHTLVEPALGSALGAPVEAALLGRPSRAKSPASTSLHATPAPSRVIVLPDGSLNSLNFETLIVPEPKPHFWIEDATITTGNSLSMLVRTAQASPCRGRPFRAASCSVLLIGDAIPVPEFGPLPQAAAEIQKIQPYFPQTRRAVLQGAQATPSAYLKSHPDRYAYLHFVTHGTASRARPLESAVVLSKEPGTDIYKLYARDIVMHPLHAELVTISACNGSGTRAYSGEGLVGLSWAFLRAGAHNVIGALWEVSDVSTPQLMDKMYAELAAGKDPATALRNAKLALLHAHNVFAKPFYWAPFQLYAGS